MDSRQITQAQAAKLMAQIGRQLRYLNRLTERMQRLGFPPDDPLARAAWTARNGVYGLAVECHYLTCAGGVGRDRRE